MKPVGIIGTALVVLLVSSWACGGDDSAADCDPALTRCGTECVSTYSDPEHCGTCGNSCGPGGVCLGGSCAGECPAGETNCGGFCRDLQTDRSNCGACDEACAPDEVCSAGDCAVGCGTGLTDCGGACRDLQVDPDNCGACGETCDPGQVCSAGACVLDCSAGLTECSGACRDLQVDPANCGTCGNACDPEQVCVAGGCALSCGGLTECSGTCRDLQVDPDNCGACGHACDPGQLCSGGECALECGGPTPTLCDDRCVDTQTDPAHCGADAADCTGGEACAAGETCVAGACQLACVGGTVPCGDECADLDSNPRHCGACDAPCAEGEACFDGWCGTRPTGDADGDLISDYDEGEAEATDTDGDTTPDYLDADSDGDTIPDDIEAGDDNPATPPRDTDGDDVPDFRDLDSDSDALTDADEIARGTDPIDEDSDGDGESDGVEVAGGSDPLDPASTVGGHGGFVFDLVPGGVDRTDTLTFEPAVQKADVLFVIDTTGSMTGEINNLQTSLSTVVSDVRGVIPDTAFGVSRFDDFPTGGYGDASCGTESDYPFQLEQRVTTVATAIQAGVDALDAPLHCGLDYPESQIEALYQAATGAGFRSPTGAVWSSPFDAATGYDPALGHGTIGGAGFRADALPILVMATDDTFHRHWSDTTVAAGDRTTWCGETSSAGCDAYASADFGAAADQQPKTRDQALAALGGIGAKVIGIASETSFGSDQRTELSAFAVRTGSWIAPDAGGNCAVGFGGAAVAAETWDPDGPGPSAARPLCPLVYSVREDGSGLAGTVSDAIMDLALFMHFSTLHTEARDNPATPAVDESRFYLRGIPVSADPATCSTMPGVADRLPPPTGDGAFDSFIDVPPGCLVTFQIVAQNDGFVPATCEDQVFDLDVIIVGDDVVEADRRTVVVRVPGDPTRC
jgi:hypothetical protein